MTTLTAVPTRIVSPTARSARALAVIGATAAALVAWAIASPLATLTVHAGSGPGTTHVGAASVAPAAVLAGLLGWGLLAALERTISSARTTWTVIAFVVLAISFAGPLSAGVGAATVVALVCIHLAAAGVLIPALSRTAGRR
ncbi:MAG: hypothetical protein QOH12_3653 [Solirubrobacteraceae bacterium]|jgi:hypothetical protein|nr:hypothetical protein [Solirubrobacteraceae bacterium]